MPATPRRRAAFFGVLILFIAIPLLAQDENRLQQIADELGTLQTSIEKLPENARERKRLEKNRDRLEKEKDILQRRQIRDARQSARSRLSQEKPVQRLEAALSDLDFNQVPLTTRRDKVMETTRSAIARKDNLGKERQRLSGLAATADRDLKLAANREQLLTVGEELKALQAQREAVDRRLELAREAESVQKRLRDEPSAPDLHLRLWFERRRELAERIRHQAEIGELNLDAGEDRSVAEEDLAFAKENLQQLEEEVEFRQPKSGLFAEKNSTEALLAAARRDRDAMAARLPFVVDQFNAREEAQIATSAHVDLLRKQVDWLVERQALFTDRLVRWLGWPLAVAVFLAIGFLGVSYLILPRIYRNELLVGARRVNRYCAIAAIVTAFAVFFLEDLRALATALGIVSAALVIALQDVFTSLAGWLALIASRKMRVGDRVEIDGVKGDVLEIELLRTTLLEVDGGLGTDEPSGRVVALPNSFIFRSRVHNSSHGHRWVWSRSDITVTYESPLAEAGKVLRRALEEETADSFNQARADAKAIETRYGRIDAEYSPKLYYNIADSGVQFTMLFICDCRGHIAAKDKLHRRILADFARDTRLQFAYPTQREFGVQEQPISTTPTPNLPEMLSAPANGRNGTNGNGTGNSASGLLGNGKQLTAWPENGAPAPVLNPDATKRT